MHEPIKARVALPCTLRSPASMEARAEGVTVELTRDQLLVVLPFGSSGESLRPGLAVVAEVELPVSDGRAPRRLQCAASVRWVERAADGIRAALDVTSMTFTAARAARARRPP